MSQILVSSFLVAKYSIKYLCTLSLRCIAEITPYSRVYFSLGFQCREQPKWHEFNDHIINFDSHLTWQTPHINNESKGIGVDEVSWPLIFEKLLYTEML